MICAPVKQSAHTPGIWNPLPYFDTVQDDGQLGNIQSLSNYFKAARRGDAAGGVVDRARQARSASTRRAS